jgi:hypothetical protein
VPTKDVVAWFGSASRSQRKDIMVDLVRMEALALAVFQSPGHGEPLV